MRISQVARSTGIPTTTLRYYDSLGLIGARRESNGYRSYDETVLERLSSLRLLRDRLAAATGRVAECPDSGESCRSEYMSSGERASFDTGEDVRIHHWQTHR
ncbi:MAG: MerR family transcriptional regulator [Actinobacteria bacterium]|nr:MerR family transcriptional regulator [Actinomycetota bacterium]